MIFYWRNNMSIDRFIKIQERDYNKAYEEISAGYKKSHYMWYIFPQLAALGSTSTSKYYGIKDLDEAKEYINNKYLRDNLINLCKVLLELGTNNPKDIFGNIDSLKLRSSMTLFELVSDDEVFGLVLDKYYNGIRDELTLNLVK